MLLIGVILLASAHNLQSATVAKEKGINMDVIRFPVDEHTSSFDSKLGKLQASLDNKFGDSDVPESCRNQTFCTIMPPNYPEMKFNDMFKGYARRTRRETNTTVDIYNKTIDSYGVSEQRQPKIPPMPTVDVLGNRQGDPNFDNGCETLATFEPLYKVRTKRDEDAWRTVIQAPSHDFIQRVRLETCMSTGSCFKPLMDTNPQYETACVQMYTSWELLVETIDGKGTERIKAELPTCCSCKYREMKFVTRFADIQSSPANKTKA